MMHIKFFKDFKELDYIDAHKTELFSNAVLTVAHFVVDYIGGNWSANSPSSPGEPPAVVTGTLDESVYTENAGRSASGTFAKGGAMQSQYIQVSAPYAAFLEFGTAKMAPRPFISPAVFAAEREFGTAIKVTFARRFR